MKQRSLLFILPLLMGCVTTPPLPLTPSLVIDQASTEASLYPKHIALLLPMQGQYASTSQAIQIGFLAAAAQEKQVSHQAVDIKTYDSSNKNIERLYQLAVSEHADFIVGPLSKAEVTSLAASTAHLPILALNTLDKNNQNTPARFFQFGLSPKDEIKQLTDRAWQNGHRHAMIISAKDEWGRGLQKNFKSAWGSLGGTVTAELGFSRDDIDFFNPIQEQLVDKKVVPDKKIRIPPARHDIDIIFLASFPKQARQIHPAINFFYAGSVPVYGMSSLYSGASDPQRDQDLNGIYFVEMPWILNPLALPQALPEIYQAIHAEFPLSSGFQNKFYAFGIDAYQLIAYLIHPKNFPADGIPGATGHLFLKNNQEVYRQLQWAKMHDGRI